MGVGSGSIFPLGSTISSLQAVWELKQEPQEFQRTVDRKEVCEVLLLILCPQTEPSSPSLITPAPQNSLLGPGSLSGVYLRLEQLQCLLALLHCKGLPPGGLVAHSPEPSF